VSAVFISSPIVGPATGVAAVVGGVAGTSEPELDAFHIATAAMPRARIAVAGSNHLRMPVSAGGVDAGVPEIGGPLAAMVGADGDGVGFATGGSGTGGVTW
jgi:hypothetical protein